MSKKLKNKNNLWEKSSNIININKQITLLKQNKRKIHKDEELYYNDYQNQLDIKQYYQPIADLDLSRIQLFYKFKELLNKTHKNRIPYFISKDLYLYTWVDLQPDGTIKSIYSGEERNPQSLIMNDFEIISQKYDDFQLFLQKIKKKEFETFRQLKDFEVKLKLNTEHIVPQSWFGGLEPMKGDLHHLFTCNPKCNISRSNFPYTDFTFYKPESPDEPIQNHCGIAVGGRFEPEYGKGIVARAMLYFLIRYPRSIKKSFRIQIDIPLLIRWHQEFPVSLSEKHRNQAIYQIQGNRNPFIDLPKLVEQIEFPNY
ncbi:endonuclease I family protein [Bacillus sp. CGMCC 1.16607]|uniref:endonuclease I family protein n=1 Tax=Bacillus sp. CGMCC 1.16607 TaxID=3351842 RepID=UPI00363128A9